MAMRGLFSKDEKIHIHNQAKPLSGTLKAKCERYTTILDREGKHALQIGSVCGGMQKMRSDLNAK